MIRKALTRRTLVINLVLAVLLATGIATAYFMITSNRPATATTQRTVPVAQGTVTASVTADGSVQPANLMSADFTTAGRVTEIKVKLGEVVKAGQVLATVDATEPNAELSTAKKNLDAAQDALDRAGENSDESSEAAAENQVDQAEAAVAAAQRKVDGTILKAPMAGTVVAVNGTVGGSSNASAGLGDTDATKGFIQLADLSKMEIAASVPEADATRLKADQVVSVTWNALTGVTVNGKVTSISPTASSTGNVVTYPIVVSLDTVPEGTRLGQSVKLTVTIDRVENAVYVPNAAIRSAGGRHLATVVKDGKQEIRPVQIGLKGDSFTVITSGLSVGEQVVLATATAGTGGTIQQFPPGLGPGGGGVVRPGGGGITR